VPGTSRRSAARDVVSTPARSIDTAEPRTMLRVEAAKDASHARTARSSTTSGADHDAPPSCTAVGCKKCPAFSICPLKIVIGDQKKAAETTSTSAQETQRDRSRARRISRSRRSRRS
jgi:hypothetical protein